MSRYSAGGHNKQCSMHLGLLRPYVLLNCAGEGVCCCGEEWSTHAVFWKKLAICLCYNVSTTIDKRYHARSMMCPCCGQ
jgi:hypothetical protein